MEFFQRVVLTWLVIGMFTCLWTDGKAVRSKEGTTTDVLRMKLLRMLQTLEYQRALQVKERTNKLRGLGVPSQPACGKPAIKSNLPEMRIVNGIEAVAHSWPWQCQYEERNSLPDRPGFVGISYCGCSVISKRWVVFAAHCVKSPNPDNRTVTVGMHNKKANEPDRRVVNIARVIKHPDYIYKPVFPINDIALIELATDLTFNDDVSPVCLPTSDFFGKKCVFTGWGSMLNYGDGPVPDVLMEATGTVKVLPQYIQKVFPGLLYVSTSGGKSSCSGDAGGPVVCRDSPEDAWQLVGVSVSGGTNDQGHCTTPNRYTRVTAYESWITSYTGVKPP